MDMRDEAKSMRRIEDRRDRLWENGVPWDEAVRQAVAEYELAQGGQSHEG